MAKAVVTNRIYLDSLDKTDRARIIEALTYKIVTDAFTRDKKYSKKIEHLPNYKLHPGGVMSLPQSRFDLIPEGYETIDKRITVDVPFPLPQFPLRESQQEIYDVVDDSCFINAKVGFGKTFLALHIARKLGQKTLIVVHTLALKDQWIQEIEALYGMTPGEVSAGKFDVEDHAIVVGNIQSLKKHADKLGKMFGTIVLDEAHHCPAGTFADFIDKSYARYRIGLSGTMSRKDKKDVLLTDFFSQTVFTPEVDNTIEPKVTIVNSGVHLNRNKDWAGKVNELLYDEAYQQFIASLATKQIERGHRVLILASRIEFLEKVHQLIPDSSLVTGATQERQQVLDDIDKGKINCIVGSRQIFSEGISANILSALILAEPMRFEGTLEQIIGRIMRKHDDKLNPEVFDINFADPNSRSQNNARLAFYMKQGWAIKKI